MDIATKDEFLIRKDVFVKRIKEGAVFIYPTDTIYGIGCNALDKKAVERIRKLKQRQDVPFSVIAPSKKWIYDNCEVPENAFKWIEKLPGPYTLIFKLSNKKAVSNAVNCGWGTLGVRIPKNWFAKTVEELGFPVVTTSANVSGENFMTSRDDIDSRVSSKADFMVYEGEKKGKPSTIVNFAEEEIEITRR